MYKQTNRIKLDKTSSSFSKRQDEPNKIVNDSFSSMNIVKKLQQAVGGRSNDAVISLNVELRLDDRVNIDLDFELVQTLQIGHGGWCEAMFECLGTTGIVSAIDNEFDVEVTYPSGAKWTFNPAVLTLAARSSSIPSVTNIDNSIKLNNELETSMKSQNLENSNLLLFNSDLIKFHNNDLVNVSNNQYRTSNDNANLIDLNLSGGGDVSSSVSTDHKNTVYFELNDLVEIISNIEHAKTLQHGHGEWADEMLPTLGKIGRIIQIYPDNDLKIEVCGTTWTYNPLAVTKLESLLKNKKILNSTDLNEGELN